MKKSSEWDEKYLLRGEESIFPEKLLVEDVEQYEIKGDVLDLACGDGRNALYLASRGMSVTAIDYSKVAIQRLHSFARKEGLNINTLVIDLEDRNSFQSLGLYDTIIINCYRLRSDLYQDLIPHLNENGILWVHSFSKRISESSHSSSFFLKEEDFSEIKDQMNCIDMHKYILGDKEFTRYIWRKRGSNKRALMYCPECGKQVSFVKNKR